ncbi:phytase [Pseudoxanthomonas wuyuanensis]|uniref:3-phytase n=1 Tax=Pseudoxanthomonas wuyuanensis TaxID=1073196 RepID=A0A286D741_9GAMM|nr:phytase [Pseudoxanthomonas wuyuanensis]KAF1721096.1 phytase [Pseudoxanthomonas wuyuanensis]SOD54468.1 3-phytase [Pseudoxanthomonas wuyuanensis]
MKTRGLGLSVLLIAAVAAGCTGQKPAAAADARDADQKASPAATPAPPDTREIPVVQEAFLTAMTPEDNIDSPASWTAPDGKTWLIATAKATDKLVVYDGQTGQTLRSFGTTGKGDGQFERPNGIAVADALVFVVERDNHRVQVLRLPDFGHVLTFGAEQLRKPYGLWVNRTGDGYEVYVTDAYMAGEDAQGEDILPPLNQLDKRVWRYAVARDGEGFSATVAGSFGDTTPDGALRVVESIWGDPANDRLLIAEEDETYANELKVYDLAGRYAGRTIGRDVFRAQSEGIMLKTCAGGAGWWLTTEQGKGRTVFHLFDRKTLEHAGAVAGARVANTDGIWLDQSASASFPEGVLYAVHDDQGVVALDWRDIAQALALPSCAAE